MTVSMPAGALEVRRAIAATPARVFRAWTDPAELASWYGLADDWRTAAEVDLRVGGRYRLELRPPGGGVIVEQGEYVEIVPGERLVYTQTSDGGEAGEQHVVVTVEFRARPDGCEVVVTETGTTDDRVRDLHLRGWPRFLDRLARAS